MAAVAVIAIFGLLFTEAISDRDIPNVHVVNVTQNRNCAVTYNNRGIAMDCWLVE